MERERFIFDAGPDAEAAALREATEDLKAGRVVSHEEVAKWLKTWGTPGSGPPPKSWFE